MLFKTCFLLWRSLLSPALKGPTVSWCLEVGRDFFRLPFVSLFHFGVRDENVRCFSLVEPELCPEDPVVSTLTRSQKNTYLQSFSTTHHTAQLCWVNSHNPRLQWQILGFHRASLMTALYVLTNTAESWRISVLLNTYEVNIFLRLPMMTNAGEISM